MKKQPFFEEARKKTPEGEEQITTSFQKLKRVNPIDVAHAKVTITEVKLKTGLSRHDRGDRATWNQFSRKFSEMGAENIKFQEAREDIITGLKLTMPITDRHQWNQFRDILSKMGVQEVTLQTKMTTGAQSLFEKLEQQEVPITLQALNRLELDTIKADIDGLKLTGSPVIDSEAKWDKVRDTLSKIGVEEIITRDERAEQKDVIQELPMLVKYDLFVTDSLVKAKYTELTLTGLDKLDSKGWQELRDLLSDLGVQDITLLAKNTHKAQELSEKIEEIKSERGPKR